MRIVGGQFKGRRLQAPRDNRIRPTTDRVRESLFNILSHAKDDVLTGCHVLDMFAGTGAFGLEALSRGAAHVTFVDQHPASLTLAKANAGSLGVLDACRFIRVDARRLPVASQPCSLVFADPPYGKGLGVPAIEQAHLQGWIDPETWVLLETSSKETLSVPDAMQEENNWKWSDVRVTLFFLAE
jgi:16S rRNA (guanine966-N2)-methyltransferase